MLLLFDKLLLGLFELFLLLLSDLNDLATDKHLLLHLLQLFDELLLLGLGLLFGLFLGLELIHQLLLFLSLQVGLVLDHGPLFLGFKTDLLLLLGKAFFELAHFLMVDDHLSSGLVARDDTVHGHDLIRRFALVERVQLLLEFLDLFLILTQECVFWVLVDAWLVLDVLRTARISQSVHSLIEIVVSRADIGNHDSLGVATKRVLQQTRQLTVTIGNVGRLGVGQR